MTWPPNCTPSSRPTPDELIALLDGIATSIIWLDGDGAVVHLNEPAEDLFGLSRNQAMGRALRDLLKVNAELEGVISARARRGRAVFAARESRSRPVPARRRACSTSP